MSPGLVQLAARLANLRHRGTSLLILAYHRVLDERDPMRPDIPDCEIFESQMQALAESFQVLPLGEAAALLEEGRLPPTAVAITFDDGYADNHRNALPILKRHGLPATFFVATDYLDGGCMFNDCVIEACRAAPTGDWDTLVAPVGEVSLQSQADRLQVMDRLLAALKYQELDKRQRRSEELLARTGAPRPTGLMMTAAQVRELRAAGMEVGGHTHHHPILSRLDAADSAADIARGREELQSIIGEPVSLFAYPNGQPQRDYLWRDVEILERQGFRAAVSTAWGVAVGGGDLLQLPRLGFPEVRGEDFTRRLVRGRAGAAGSALGPRDARR